MTAFSLARVAALGALVVLAACGSKIDGPSPQPEGAQTLYEIELELWAYECECFAHEYGESTEACLEEARTDGDELETFYACIEEVLSQDDEARTILDCQLKAARDYLRCLNDQGCPESFACSDGTKIPAEWVCDGAPDCAGGEDEHGDCRTEPFVCNDGETLPGGWVCDGWPDCEGGEDEHGDCPTSCDASFVVTLDACGDLDRYFDRVFDECDDEVEPHHPDCEGEWACASLPPEPSSEMVSQALPAKARAKLSPLVLRKL